MCAAEEAPFRRKLQDLINENSVENRSNTPDFILAIYLDSCLRGFDHATKARDDWYGVNLEPGNKFFKGE